ncbi:MAG TPA: DUF4190 domain-containing protein [Anaerolineae bacterium]|nr:DUF4190 domain-containing protein [Anaerolineae bacterium]
MKENTNQMALASLISALVAWGLGFLGGCVVSMVFPPLGLCTGILFLGGNVAAVVTGHMARNQIKQSGGEGGEMAMVGLVLGWIGLGFIALCILCLICFLFSLPLLGPEIGSVFSEVIETLETPVP